MGERKFQEQVFGIFGYGNGKMIEGTLKQLAHYHNGSHSLHFLKKNFNRHCTWKYPKWTTKNEFDLIPTIKHLTIKDVNVLNEFRTENYHMKIRVKASLNSLFQRCLTTDYNTKQQYKIPGNY